MRPIVLAHSENVKKVLAFEERFEMFADRQSAMRAGVNASRYDELCSQVLELIFASAD
jgi:hypothetical protein